MRLANVRTIEAHVGRLIASGTLVLVARPDGKLSLHSG